MDPLLISSIVSLGVNLAQGAARSGKAKRMRSEYDKFEASIPEQDPTQVSQLAEVRRQRQAYNRGSDALTSFASEQARNMGAQTQANIVRAGRGNVSDLLRSQGSTDQAIGAAGARAMGAGNQLLGMEGSLVNAMAERAYNRQLSKANRMYSEWGAMKEGSNQAIQAGLAMLPTFTAGFGGGRQGGGGVARKPNLHALYAYQPQAYTQEDEYSQPVDGDGTATGESPYWDGDY